MTIPHPVVYATDTMTGSELRRARKRMGMTQREFGEALDLAKNTIARMERDELSVVRTTEMAVRFLLSKKRKGGK